MTTHAPKGWGYRLGSSVGRAWRVYGGREQRVVEWLVKRDVPVSVATASLWIAKLVMLGVLLYVAFWLTLLLLFAVAVVWAAQSGALDSDGEQSSFVEDELSKLRRTPGYDPNLYNDTAHEMYEDD